MASIEYRARSVRVVAYINKAKQTFTLGKVPKKTAERFANNIDTLINERKCNLAISRDVRNWLADLDSTIYQILEDHQLVEPRIQSLTLAPYVDSYIDTRTDVSECRKSKFKNTKERLIEFFGDLRLDKVTPGSADEYARWLLTKLAPATAQKECQIAAQFFRHAFRKGLIERIRSMV